MDFFSHALLPYLSGNFFKRNKEEVTAFVLGGMAPDFDILLLLIQYLYPTFLLITHRGLTHSLFFGFFTALAVLYLASRSRVKNKVRRFIDFDITITRRTVAFAYAGVLLHLFLDYMTTRGIPLLYPLDTTRYSIELFFYTDIFLTILSLVIIIVLYKKPLQRNNNARFLMIYLIIFAGLGTVRLVEKNSAENFFHASDLNIYPEMSPFTWYALGEDSNNIKIYEYSGLGRTILYNVTVPRLNITPEGNALDSSLAAGDELPQVKMFRWRAYAVAINASFSEGAWHFEYYDPLQRVMIRDVPSIFRRTAANLTGVRVKVEGGRAIIS